MARRPRAKVPSRSRRWSRGQRVQKSGYGVHWTGWRGKRKGASAPSGP